MKKYYDDYFSVVNKKNGKVIVHCGDENDAILMCSLKPDERTYRKEKFIMDQVIDISSTTDKQLPGQIGLPPGQYKIADREIYALEESDLELVDL
jgi:hypothetical protein